ncbi:MAG: hypothetical protein RMJ19_12255 [Gemmatales bacterium]|nr:hypothetical protein [Gemmatales bacterium]MDW8176438.1 hypothetical protein [Gemmatales bacterium]
MWRWLTLASCICCAALIHGGLLMHAQQPVAWKHRGFVSGRFTYEDRRFYLHTMDSETGNNSNPKVTLVSWELPSLKLLRRSEVTVPVHEVHGSLVGIISSPYRHREAVGIVCGQRRLPALQAIPAEFFLIDFKAQQILAKAGRNIPWLLAITEADKFLLVNRADYPGARVRMALYQRKGDRAERTWENVLNFPVAEIYYADCYGGLLRFIYHGFVDEEELKRLDKLPEDDPFIYRK